MYLHRFYSKVTGLKRLPSQRKGKYKNQQKGDKIEQQGLSAAHFCQTHFSTFFILKQS